MIDPPSTRSGAQSMRDAPQRSRKPAPRPSIVGRLSENLGLKILSLIVALGFYAFLHGASNAQRTLQVPVVADMPPAGVARQLITEIPETIGVVVEGPRQPIDKLESKLDPIPLNLRSARDEVVVFTPEMVHGLPPGVRVTRFIPESLRIHWENAVSRELDVQVPITGQLGKGLELKGGVAVQPARVTASGAESAVDSLQLARAEPFELSGLGEGGHTRSLPLAQPPNVSFSESAVQATVEVVRRMVVRELEVKVVILGSPRAKAVPPSVRVVVEGTPERIDALRPEAVLARVDLKAAGVDLAQPGNEMLPVAVDVPDAKVSIDPPQVLVKW